MNRTRVVVLLALGSSVTLGQRPARPDPLTVRGAVPEPAASGSVAAAASGQGVAMLLDDQSRYINFQALLTSEQGNPINMPNGEHELDFRLYDSAAGGEPVGEVLDVVVTLDDGVASTQVGPMDPAWFDGTARWMGVTVDNGEELTPLIPLGAVPYAFRVDRVASLELDDDIALGDPATSGSLTVFSGASGTETITLIGEGGRLRVGNPFGQGGTTIHGPGQLIATRDDNGVLVALYGHDGIDGGAACLLGTATGSIGLSLDGNAPGGTGGAVTLYTGAAAEAISLTAADGTIRAGSVEGGVAGQMHLFPAAGGASRIHLDGQDGHMRLGLSGTSSGDLRAYSAGGGIETIHLDGDSGQITANRVGIGTQNAGNYRLAVNGPIRAKEIVVETGWSDFVFESDYDLPTLEEWEAHIREYGHLPDIPSAADVAKHGVKVGEVESRLLQKIEELTLHLIDMNKRLDCLEEENAQLRGGSGPASSERSGE
jgi:hypothetical protein